MVISFEVDVLKFIQQFSCPALDVFFSAVSMLAEQLVLIAAITYIYWNLNKDAGKQIAYAVFVSVSLNSGLKNLFNFTRPIGIDGIRSHYTGTATGSSFPSGHTQCFSTAAFSLAARMKKRRVYLTAAALTFLVALSRLYLGVHFPKDVLAGGLLGIIISFLCAFLCRKIRQKSLLYLVSFALMLPFLFLNTSEDYFKSLGLFFGFLIGNFIEGVLCRGRAFKNRSRLALDRRAFVDCGHSASREKTVGRVCPRKFSALFSRFPVCHRNLSLDFFFRSSENLQKGCMSSFHFGHTVGKSDIEECYP